MRAKGAAVSVAGRNPTRSERTVRQLEAKLERLRYRLPRPWEVAFAGIASEGGALVISYDGELMPHHREAEHVDTMRRFVSGLVESDPTLSEFRNARIEFFRP
jgi:hypothetical protein